MIFDNKLKKTKNNVKPYGFTIIGIIIIIIAILSVTTVAVVTYEVIKNNSESSPSEIQTSEDSNSSKTSSNKETGSSDSSESTDFDSTKENQTNDSSSFYSFANYISGIAKGVTDNTVPSQIDEINDISLSKIVASNYFTCENTSVGYTYCWGNNSSGQLGNNSTTNSLVPVSIYVSGILNSRVIKSIDSKNSMHSCVITSDDQAYCWGQNDNGQLGNNSTTSSLVPVAVDTSGLLNGKTIQSISVGSYHSCAIASDDQAYCWGQNNYGQLGNNSKISSSVPVAVDMSGVLSGKTIKSISAGYNHTCAIASDNKVYCWGINYSGELGHSNTIPDFSLLTSSVPVAVDMSGVLSGKTIKSISAGFGFTCLVASDNQIYCWGANYYGQLGNGDTEGSSSPFPVSVDTSGVLNGKTIQSIYLGDGNACAIASDDQAYCWGGNSSGQLGNNSTADSFVPVAVDTSGLLNNKKIKSIGLAYVHTCVITLDEQTYCWGDNEYGQLGNNSITSSLVPVRVTFPAS